MSKKYFVKTYGCQMNEYDSGKMSDVMQSQGYQKADDATDADVIILNTCHIREKASEKVYSELGRIKKKALKNGKQPLIAVAGCVAQAEGAEIMKRAPSVNMVFGPQSYHHLPDFLAKAEKGEKVLDTEFYEEKKFENIPLSQPDKVSAFLSVQEGCDKFCSFCVVPYTRGAEFSRPVEAVITEAKNLIAAGIKEITLLGQNVNAYHGTHANGKTLDLGELLFELAKLDGLERLRYTTSHPLDMHDSLYAAHRDIDKIMPYLHLPIQSGSNRILKLMNRKHERDDYLRVIEKMRHARPDLALSGDFIVGFPSETEQDFLDTMDIIEQVGYASSFYFKYSARPGTPAAERNNEMILDAVASERLERLQALLTTQQKQFNQSLIGKTLPVLVEKYGRHTGQLIGRSPYLQSVHFESTGQKFGDMVYIHITECSQNSLTGNLIVSDT